MLKSLLLFVVIAGLFYFMANPYFYQYLNAVTKNKVPKQKAVMVTAVIFAALLMMIMSSFLNIKEGFYFEVSPNKPRCSKGLVGRPSYFQYSSDAALYGDWNRPDYNTNSNCQQVEDEIKNQPACMGRDGFLGRPVNVGSVTYKNI
jgi:hypothetical protein